MNELSGLLGRVGERKDILLVVLLLAVVFMMVLPLPPLLLDILIAVNITISVVLLMMSVYIGSPLQFSVFPAVLLITGSGVQDGDESLFGHQPFRVWADHLARAGIASLRVDDRGVGGTGGTLAEATSADLAADDGMRGLAASDLMPVMRALLE